MEAAGWQVARFCREPAVVVCGVGNNAGDGLAAARHLHRRGLLEAVCCVDEGRLRGDAARELEALHRLGVSISSELVAGRHVVDAIFGTGLSRPPEGRFSEWIDGINRMDAEVVAVDLPSGLDAESGVAYAPLVKAAVTITLGLPKRGLAATGGRVMVADIGIPFEAFAAIGVEVPPDLFAKGDLVPL